MSESAANPAYRRPRAIVVFIAVAAAALGLDLWLKAWSFEHVAGVPVHLTAADAGDNRFWDRYPHESQTLVPSVLSLKLTTNTGAVFGLGKGSRWFFMVMSVIAAGVIGWIFARSSAKAYALHIALALILAGALGNLYDRVRFAAVRDMLYLFPGVELPFGLTWPGGIREVYPWIFNIADVALVIGVGVLMILLWTGDKRPQTAPASRD